MRGIFLAGAMAIIVLSACDDGGKSLPATCGPNTCNEAVGGGTCDDSSGHAVCTCNEGYTGIDCKRCAKGYTEVDGACLPTGCGENTCNEQNGAGTCDDSSGRAVCTCSEGYVGPTCRQCAAGWHPAGDDRCERDSHPACQPAEDGGSTEVQAPTLRMTLPASWDENWLASPAVADLDGDGVKEIIASRHSVLYVWEPDGTLKWRAAIGHEAHEDADHGNTRMWPSPVVGDLDGDGYLEIAVASGYDSEHHCNITVYDHEGNFEPGWPVAFGENEIRSITAGDLDGDGYYEIVVNKTSKGPVTAVFEMDGTMRPGWPQVNHDTCDPTPPAEQCWDFGGYNQNIGLADMDGDGYLDVITTYDAIGFGIFDRDGRPFPAAEGYSDAVVTAVEAYHDPELSKQGWGTGDRSEFTYSPPSFGDIDGDGDLEVVLAGDHEHTTSTENRGVTLWVLNHDVSRPPGWEWPKDFGPPLNYDGDFGPNIVHTMPNPTVANINEDPAPEIIVPGYDGALHCYGADGNELWKYVFSDKKEPFTGAGEALVADLSGDGVPEIIFTTYVSGDFRKPDIPAHLIILNNNGVELHKIEIAVRGSMAAPTIDDIDGDGQPELIISLKDTLGGGDGGVQIWDLPGAKMNCLLWPTGRGNYLRQGIAAGTW